MQGNSIHQCIYLRIHTCLLVHSVKLHRNLQAFTVATSVSVGALLSTHTAIAPRFCLKFKFKFNDGCCQLFSSISFFHILHKLLCITISLLFLTCIAEENNNNNNNNNMKRLLLLTLLAVCLTRCAHARNQLSVASSVAAATAAAARDKHAGVNKFEQQQQLLQGKPPTISVVQNWSLVCQQLCGAGLGGAPCASVCTAHNLPSIDVRQKNAREILDPNKEPVCDDLCELQLGDESCKCTKQPSKSHNTCYEDYNLTCETFCINNHATLAGCTRCQLGCGAAGCGDDDCDTAIGVDDETTPDWNELCISLCKTGDGGSLCNCDLSPF